MLGFTDDFTGIFVVPHSDELGVPKVVGPGPLQELDLSDGIGLEQASKKIDDILRKDAGVSSELDYIEQTSWLLFLKYLDAVEQDRRQIAEFHVQPHTFLLDKPYRWHPRPCP